tara:strand:- start:1995 stop:2225 length:231 start_codon:yes stop_codon:yes gene_type:complete
MTTKYDGRGNPALNEVTRLRNVYDKTYEKYDKRMDNLVEKRDQELEYIWKAIMDEEEKVPEGLKFLLPNREVSHGS